MLNLASEFQLAVDAFAFHRAFQARPRIAAYIASGRRPSAFGIVIDGMKMDPRQTTA